MAMTGGRNRGLMRLRKPEAGRPPSRAKAKIMRETDVTVARPQRYWAETMVTWSAVFTAGGMIWSIVQKNTDQPWAAALSTSGMATTILHRNSHPKTADQITEPIIARGTLRAA